MIKCICLLLTCADRFYRHPSVSGMCKRTSTSTHIRRNKNIMVRMMRKFQKGMVAVLSVFVLDSPSGPSHTLNLPIVKIIKCSIHDEHDEDRILKINLRNVLLAWSSLNTKQNLFLDEMLFFRVKTPVQRSPLTNELNESVCLRLHWYCPHLR